MSEKTLAVQLVGADYIHPMHPGGSLTRNLRLAEVPLAEPRKGEALVEPLAVGLCGSDVSAALGKPNFSWVARPRTLGHECSVRILAFGPGTEASVDLRVGDAAVLVSMRGCGDPRCRGCRQGRPNYCRKREILGFHRDGAFAERFTIDVGRLMPLRYGLSPLEGAVVEPLSVVSQSVGRKSRIRPGMDVVVSGCGIIGLMAAELARAAGARVAVTGVEQDREVRLRLAERRGFIPIVVGEDKPLPAQLAAGITDRHGQRFGDPYADGCVDALFECSGSPAALAIAGLAVQFEGSISVIATYPTNVPFEATPFTRSGQWMSGTMGSDRDDYENAQKLLRDKLFPVAEYARLYPFERAIEAFEDSIMGRTPKAVLQGADPSVSVR